MLNLLMLLHFFVLLMKISKYSCKKQYLINTYLNIFRKRSHIYRYQLEQQQQQAQPMMIMTLMMDEHGQHQQQPMIMF